MRKANLVIFMTWLSMTVNKEQLSQQLRSTLTGGKGHNLSQYHSKQPIP